MKFRVLRQKRKKTATYMVSSTNARSIMYHLKLNVKVLATIFLFFCVPGGSFVQYKGRTAFGQRSETKPEPKKEEKPIETKVEKSDTYKPALYIMPERALTPGDKDLIREAVYANIDPKTIAKPKKDRNLLIFDLNVDYLGHRAIVYANYAFQMLADRTKAFKPTIAHEATAFDAENLKQFDAVVFNNTVGNLFEDKQLRQNLEDFVQNGGGLLALHSATDGFVCHGGEQIGKDDWPLFGEMIGARGMKHRESDEKVFVRIEAHEHPLVQMFPKEGFFIREEILRFDTPYSREKRCILLSLDNAQSNLRRPPFDELKERSDEDYALAWVKNFGNGRCCYSAFGHNPKIFWDPKMLRFHLAAMQFVLGDLDGPTEPVH